MKTEPVRRFAGCGRLASQRDLVRFVARDGVLVHGHPGAGRGVYTCRQLACFEAATAQRGFARTLKQPVRVDPALARLYTGGANA